jgi:hypothetical protein
MTALRWLGKIASDPERSRHRTDIVRSLEGVVIQSLDALAHHDPSEVQPIVVRQLLPLLESDLVQTTDPVFRRFAGFLAGLRQEGRGARHYSGSLPDGTPVTIVVLDEEIENQAASVFAGTTQPESITRSSVEVAIVKPLDDSEHEARIVVDVPILNLLLLDRPDVSALCIDLLLQYFEEADPPTAQVLTNARTTLLEGDAAARRAALRQFALAYLKSVGFGLKVDPSGAFRHLSEMPLRGFADYLHVDTHADDPRRLSIRPRQGRGFRSVAGTIVLLTLEHTAMREAAQRILTDVEAAQLPSLVTSLVAESESSPNMFTRAWTFFLALFLNKHVRDEAASQVLAWSKEYVRVTLEASLMPSDRTNDADAFRFLQRERLRRTLHARAMQISFWIAATERHVKELSQISQDEEAVSTAWLLMGLTLTTRILAIAREEWVGDADEGLSRLEQAMTRLGVDVKPEFFPDTLNPFIFGPDDFDHALAALLTTLLNSWSDLSEGASDVPVWWSAAVASLLEGLSNRAETAGEAQLRDAQAKKKPNRLGVIIGHTVPDLARALLARYAERRLNSTSAQ